MKKGGRPGPRRLSSDEALAQDCKASLPCLSSGENLQKGKIKKLDKLCENR